jgi:hypothetical protein
MSIKDDEIPKHRSKKDTKRWCGGKPGREHTPMWVIGKLHNPNHSSEWFDYKCQRCQKVIDYYWKIGIEWAKHIGSEEYERPEIGSTEPLKKKVTDG